MHIPIYFKPKTNTGDLRSHRTLPTYPKYSWQVLKIKTYGPRRCVLSDFPTDHVREIGYRTLTEEAVSNRALSHHALDSLRTRGQIAERIKVFL